MSDRGNETIVETIAIVKHVVLASRLVFEFKTRNRKYAIIAFRCDNSLLPDPFSHVFRGLGHETSPDGISPHAVIFMLRKVESTSDVHVRPPVNRTCRHSQHFIAPYTALLQPQLRLQPTSPTSNTPYVLHIAATSLMQPQIFGPMVTALDRFHCMKIHLQIYGTLA